ncbi:MAG: hypothetical protein HKN47_11500 [Pirellulaceae bacterium]|nr:hypothetical protein [Pirellulaceae bacterium]
MGSQGKERFVGELATITAHYGPKRDRLQWPWGRFHQSITLAITLADPTGDHAGDPTDRGIGDAQVHYGPECVYLHDRLCET